MERRSPGMPGLLDATDGQRSSRWLAADALVQHAALVDTLELLQHRLLLRIQRQQFACLAVEQMRLIRDMIDVLLLEAIEHEFGHRRIAHFAAYDALAVEHGEGGGD